MGSSTRDKLNEVDQLRAGLEAKIVELGTRLPPAVRMTKRVMAGVGGGVGLFLLSRVGTKMKSRPKKTKGAAAGVAPAPQIVVRGGVGAPALIGAAAIWAAVRFYELKQRTERRGPAEVKDLKRGA